MLVKGQIYGKLWNTAIESRDLEGIGADSMGAMERSPPRPKSCGGDAPKSPPHEFCCHFFETVKLVNCCMYESGSTLLQSRLINWLTFCVLYTITFSNFSWSVLLCLFYLLPKFNFSSLFVSKFQFRHNCAEMLRPRGQSGLEVKILASASKHTRCRTWP